MNRRILEQAFVGLCWLLALALVGSVVTIIGVLISRGAGTLNAQLIFGGVDPWQAITGRVQVFDGILPAIAGTVALVVFSVSIALPIGIASGIYLAVYAPVRLKRVVSLCVDILASIPSIVIGLFGLALIILLHGQTGGAVRPSLLIAAIALATLVLPYIIRSTELAIDAIEPEVRLAAQACGASKLQNTLQVLIPQSLPRILSGSILAIGRCAEDTAVIMLTGAVASVGFPDSVFGRFEAIPFFIYYRSAQYADQQELAQGYGAAIVLLCICSGLFVLAHAIKRGVARRAFVRG